MSRTGVVNLPLHGGHPPKWLFTRMVDLSGAITEVIVEEYGQKEFLHRISNPYWFQAFSCVLGFDWHSSGTTTTTLGALKHSLDSEKHGIYLSGGKGGKSRKTPAGIKRAGEIFGFKDSKIEEMVNASKLTAKIDNSCIQDSYTLYQHNFFVTEKGDWAVVQQGLNAENKYARRYHWMSDGFDEFLEDPHSGISCDMKNNKALNMADKESKEAQKISVDLINDNPAHLRQFFKRKDNQMLLTDFTMPKHHPVLDSDLSDKEYEVLRAAWEIQPENYEELILLQGIGPKKIRALALISDLVYGEPASWEDPVKYSFTHGGKDGFPYPVDREVYDNSINTIKEAVEEAKIKKDEKLKAIKRLEDFLN
ncbi:MAG: DUF763 domain-containing protein [Methanobrevibacter sp.]|uniref:DUF763 domain-containing protein n=1 Tax=Methanobrevibacter sp. TaxID=66852 RepID=UPI0026DEEBB7|nr:DUF763 domain-containing protein [Methanobrevibacter sp.]MDO5848227.1 DUF763 domain-containing protein [Methanobrevibacter sp.]